MIAQRSFKHVTKYLKAATFILAALETMSIMFNPGSNILRYQYHDFTNRVQARGVIDLVLVILAVFLMMRHLMQKNSGLAYWIASLTWIILLIPDITVKLYTFLSVPYFIVTSFSLTILVILYDFAASVKIDLRLWLVSGLVFIALAFLFESYFIDKTSPVVSDYGFHRQYIMYNIVNWLYFSGVMLIATSLSLLAKNYISRFASPS